MIWKQPEHKPFYNANEIKEKYSVIISIGARGKGKTLAWKLAPIYDTLNNGYETIYLRRFKNELKKAKRHYLSDIYVGDPRLQDVKLEIKGNTLYVNDKPCTHFVSLSTSLNDKSISYHNVKRVIFDEFLTLGYTIRGVDEITLFSEFLETVFRLRDNVQIVLLSNAISTTSEYFKLFGFDNVDPKRQFQHPRHSKDVVLEIIMTDEDFKEMKSQSKLYSLLAPSKYKKYAIENEFIFEDDTNIMKRKEIKGHIHYIYSVATEQGILDFYNFNKGMIYVRLDKEKNRDIIFTFDKDLVMQGYVYVNSSHDIARRLSSALSLKWVFYEDMQTKKLLLMNLKKIITTYF